MPEPSGTLLNGPTAYFCPQCALQHEKACKRLLGQIARLLEEDGEKAASSLVRSIGNSLTIVVED